MSKDIADMIERCEVCQKCQDGQPREQITTPPVPSYLWHTIAFDLFEFKGKTYSDRYSKFVIVHELLGQIDWGEGGRTKSFALSRLVSVHDKNGKATV